MQTTQIYLKTSTCKCLQIPLMSLNKKEHFLIYLTKTFSRLDHKSVCLFFFIITNFYKQKKN